jgi:hypothetical protein
VLKNPKGGFVIAPVLPPPGRLLLCHPSPVLLSPQGVARRDPARKESESQAFSFEEIKTIGTEAKNVQVNGRFFVKTASAAQAAEVVMQVRKLLKLTPDARVRALEYGLKESFQTKTIQKRLDDFSARTRTMNLLANALFIYLFLLAPVVIYRFGLASIWVPLLAGLYVFTFSVAFIFRRVHLHFYPDLKNDRFTHVLINMFSPATTIRAGDVLSRSLLESFHPLAAVRVLGSEGAFRRAAIRAMVDLTYPLGSEPVVPGVDNALGKEVANSHAGAEGAAIQMFLAKEGVAANELLRPPEPADSSSLSYCPRCQSQFRIKEGTCADCGGLKLVAFGAGAGLGR